MAEIPVDQQLKESRHVLVKAAGRALNTPLLFSQQLRPQIFVRWPVFAFEYIHYPEHIMPYARSHSLGLQSFSRFAAPVRLQQVYLTSRVLAIDILGQPKTFHSSRRSFWHSSILHKWRQLPFSRGVAFTFFLAGTITAYEISTARPLNLEGRVVTADISPVEKYLPPVPSFTLEQASDTLRWEEVSRLVRMGNAVLRCDK